MYELINNVQIKIKEYKGQRVVTLKDIDMAHGRPEGTARRNFNKNRERFIEGEDYFVRNSYEAKKEFGIIAPNGLILFTENGYLMLVKSFTDDLSWQVQRQLVKTYFRVREISPYNNEVILQLAENQKVLEQKIDRLEKKLDIIAKHSDTIIKDIKKMVVDATNHVVIPCVSFIYDKFIK
ncbi:MAG: ORF6N domain-containing protein [Ruminococcus flavefaciens]|nr:ORF6N domain-containing protein [Ruminococcus flavefaciens]